MQRKLIEFLHDSAGRPFAYGQSDCTMFLANWWRRVHDVDPAADYRGRYSDDASKDELLAQEHGLQRLVARLARAAGSRRVSAPALGDFGLIAHDGKPYGAICAGRAGDAVCWAIRSPNGMSFLSNPRILQAWSINV